MIARVEHHVDFFDTDAMEVVHHSNYIRWFEIGRVEFLRMAGITLGQLMEDGYVFPITDISAKFLSPGYFDDTQNVFTNRETGKIARLPEKYYIKLIAMLKES